MIFWGPSTQFRRVSAHFNHSMLLYELRIVYNRNIMFIDLLID